MKRRARSQDSAGLDLENREARDGRDEYGSIVGGVADSPSCRPHQSFIWKVKKKSQEILEPSVLHMHSLHIYRTG